MFGIGIPELLIIATCLGTVVLVRVLVNRMNRPWLAAAARAVRERNNFRNGFISAPCALRTRPPQPASRFALLTKDVLS